MCSARALPCASAGRTSAEIHEVLRTMDAFQELFSGGDNWQTDTGRELLERKEGRDGDVTSADSTTPPPQISDGDKLAKSANSIRGLCVCSCIAFIVPYHNRSNL